ncbi:protein-L-isoaspartate(D-aspartate) O-methyltransferase [candidate division GN15 bacterium]|nr:protein-L-isoaspartate(D-aspartate) O-methyltransferase [candidate division GN15 bacterium]
MSRWILTLAASIAVSLALNACGSAEQKRTDNTNYEKRRHAMVARQLMSRDIEEQAVIDAMAAVPRHRFVPEDVRDMAYSDHPLPIGHDQTISQPYIVALMTELAQVDSSEKVLEVGTGSGYQAAVLAELCDSVFTMEIVEPLGRRADSALNALGYGDRVHVRIGDGYKGWPEQAPFDAIVVTAAPEKAPPPLIEQLADSGRLVIPVGDFYQDLIVIERRGDSTIRYPVIPVRFVPMTGDGVEGQ